MDKLLDPAFIERRVLPVVVAFAAGVLVAVSQHDGAVDRQRARADQAWLTASAYAQMCGFGTPAETAAAPAAAYPEDAAK